MLNEKELGLPWKNLPEPGMIFTEDMERHICDIRGYGALVNQFGAEKAIMMQDATGDFIIHAANSHHALVEVLEEILAFEDGGNVLWDTVADKAKVALLAAQEPCQGDNEDSGDKPTDESELTQEWLDTGSYGNNL